MILTLGTIESGFKHFQGRMHRHAKAFEDATGEALFPGTVNVRINRPVPPREHFRLSGALIDEPSQDLLFEVIRVNGIWAYRIRPYELRTGAGGHGDDVIEIVCQRELLADLGGLGASVQVTFFRNRL
jgi:hypothetical protein